MGFGSALGGRHLVIGLLLAALTGCGGSKDNSVRTTTNIGGIAISGEVPAEPTDQGPYHRLGYIYHDALLDGAVFSPDDKTLLTGSSDFSAKLWDTATGKQIGPTLQHHSPIMKLAFAPDGKTVLTASDASEVRLWNASNGEQIGKALSHQEGEAGGITALGYLSGKIALTGGRDSTVRMWDTATGAAVGQPIPVDTPVQALAASPDGKVFVAGLINNTGVLWDTAAKKKIGQPLRHTGSNGAVGTAVFSADGKLVATSSLDGSARVWDATTGKPLTPPLPFGDLAVHLRFSPDGKRLLTANSASARIWDTKTGKPLCAPCQFPKGTSGVAVDMSGAVVLAGNNDTRSATLWDVATGQPLLSPLQLTRPIELVALSPDGKLLLAGNDSGNGYIWSVARDGK
jgi:WD40 repeat protein